VKAFAILFLSCIFLSASSHVCSQSSFQVVPLGIRGGTDESNLSAYMLAPVGSNEYICLDAGTVHAGIKKAIALKTFQDPAAVVLRKYIKGFIISHGHLDHLAGMIINSPDDSVKNIYALPFVVDILKEKYFSWKSWANFADADETPLLKKYHYEVLDTVSEKVIVNTSMSVKAFALSHVNPYQSSAFLVRHNDNYVLYLGDTGADTIEHSLREMKVLSGFCKNVNPLEALPVIITQIKPNGNNESKIKTQLAGNNPFKLKLIYPQQGKKIGL
jgi:cAMP phosphodiesterase